MQIFDDITFGWDGREYKIPSNRVLGAIARIEEIMTFQELVIYQARGTLPLVKLSQAYGSALRYAGAIVTDEQVYYGMFSGSDDKNSRMVTALTTLLMMMVPKDMKQVGGGSATKGKHKRAGRRSSKNSTSFPLVKAAGSLQSNSGS